MTFKELLSHSHWEGVSVELTRLFPDYQHYMDSYRRAYDELTQSDPDVSNMRLFIGRYDENGMVPFYVIGFDGECPKGVCLKLSSWKLWLGAHISTSILSQFSEDEIIAICIYDMTWAGFSSNDVMMFRKVFIKHQNCLLAVHALIETICASESHPVRQKQRTNEIYEALGLYDLDSTYFDHESAEYRNARLDVENQIYALGESEQQYETYLAKVSALREDFLLKWPNPTNTYPQEH